MNELMRGISRGWCEYAEAVDGYKPLKVSLMVVWEINAEKYHSGIATEDIDHKWKSVIDVSVVILRVFDLEIIPRQ